MRDGTWESKDTGLMEEAVKGGLMSYIMTRDGFDFCIKPLLQPL